MIEPEPTDTGEFGTQVFGVNQFGVVYDPDFSGIGPFIVNPAHQDWGIGNEATCALSLENEANGELIEENEAVGIFSVGNAGDGVWNLENTAELQANWHTP